MTGIIRCETAEDVIAATPLPGFYPIDLALPGEDEKAFTVADLWVSARLRTRLWFLFGVEEPWTDAMMVGRRIGPRIILPGEGEDGS